MNEYSIPKPPYPLAARVLIGMVVIGLVGLGVAAYAAFSFIGRPVQALAFALIVEAGMISEAIAIVRRNWLAVPGLAVSLLVSGMYNYTQAERAGQMLNPPLTDPLQLAALSIGPLSAVLFLALAAGREISEHEKHVHQWALDRQRWLDDQAERQARRLERREARQEKLTLAVSQPAMTLTPPVNDTASGSYEDFVTVMAERNGSGPLTVAEIRQWFGVSERTAWRWLARYKETHPNPVQEVN